jgi:hypothetical protein
MPKPEERVFGRRKFFVLLQPRQSFGGIQASINPAQACAMYIRRHRRREIVLMPLIPPPNVEGYASYLALQLLDGPETLTAALGDEPVQLPALQFLKSLDDLDEEADEDDDDIEDLDEEDEEDEDDEDDLDEDYDDEDEDEDDDEDDEEEEEDDEDGGVKPLKMASSGSSPAR